MNATRARIHSPITPASRDEDTKQIANNLKSD